MIVINVKHIKDYILEVTFSNKKTKQIDLSGYLFTEINPMITKYQDLSLFKQVRIDCGDLAWGDGEMELPPDMLYKWKYIPELQEI